MSRELLPCGTVAAYVRHMNRGQTPCPKCRAARAEYSREYRRAKSRAGDYADARAVRDLLVALDRAVRVLGPLALADPVDRVMARFGDRIKDLNDHEERRRALQPLRRARL